MLRPHTARRPYLLVIFLLLGLLSSMPASAENDGLVGRRIGIGCNETAGMAFYGDTVQGGEVLETTVTGNPGGVILDQRTFTLSPGQTDVMWTIEGADFGDYDTVTLDVTYQGEPFGQNFAVDCPPNEPPSEPPVQPDFEQLVAQLIAVLIAILASLFG
jgi:hypothetical protein